MIRRSALRLVLLMLTGGPLATAVEAQPSASAPRLALEDTAAESETTIESAGTLPFPVAVRIVVPARAAMAPLEARLTALAARNIPVWLTLSAPGTADDLPAWRSIVERLAARHGSHITLLEIDVDAQPAVVVRFAAQAASVEMSAGATGVRIGLGGVAMRDPARRATVYTDEIAAYTDVLVVDPAGAAEGKAWLARVDSQAQLAFRPSPQRPDLDGFLRGTFEQLGADVAIRAWRAGDVPASALRALIPVGTLLTHQVSAVDDAGAALTATGAANAGQSLRHVLLFDEDTFSTYLAYWSERAGDRVTVDLSIPVAGTPRLYDLATTTETVLEARTVGAAAGRVQLDLPLPGRTMLVDFNDGAVPLGERSGVTAARPLTVAEIIARHQRQQRVQDALVENYVARARMEQHFRPTIADPGYDVVSENTYFFGRDGIEWEERSFSVNGSRWGADRPPFPVLQPEKVLSLPLQLRFDDGYEYRLEGTERIGEVDCYVVKFDPLRDDRSLYRGTVWIDRGTFARIRVHAVQSGLAAPVVSNDETQEYSIAATLNNRPIYLFTRLTARQILLVAGRNLLVEKKVSFGEFQVNVATFEQQRAEARDSAAVMLRETPQGLRYFEKEDGQRVVREQPTRDLKALAMGLTLDPSYGFPLPIFGINYLDFNLGNSSTQLAVLFAGVLAAGNIQRSNIGGKSLDASIDFFAIAAPSTDRVFGETGEAVDERVLTWPLSSGFNLGWQANPYMKAMLQYQFRFDGYVRDRTTSDTFVTPSTTVTNGIGGAWEYRRRGYSFVSDAAWFRRASWRPWGEGGGTVTSPSFVRYTASLSRDIYLDGFQKLHFNGSWFGSSDVDRFTKYQFGLFDNTRIHGVPASGVKLAQVGMLRGSYSLNIFEQYRVDLFLEHAWGRSEPRTGEWQRIPALGMALNLRAPFATILRVDAGKSFLPDRYDRLGSATLQIMLLKPLR